MDLERYEIAELIGHGGMASVYRAVERDNGRGTVAVKRLHPHLEHDPGMRIRFAREVEIMRALDHPGIARVREWIEDPPGFVMEYAGPRDLKAVIQEWAPMDVEYIVHISKQVLAALSYAHGRGVVHRDVKPQNILIADGDRVKLVDFGLARLQGMASLTTKSMVIGTPDYLAPELLRDHRPDPRSDLYSLGVVMYEMATGATPFSGGSPLQIIERRLNDDAPDPAAKRPDLPAGLAAAIRKALARDPADRFQAADDMARALTETPAETKAAPETAGDDRCPLCRARVAEEYPVCLECGDDSLAQVAPGRSMVLVTALSRDLKALAELKRLLDRLSDRPGADRKIRPGKKRPALLVKNVTESYAAYLAGKLATLGHETLVRDMAEPSSDLLSRSEKLVFFFGFLFLYFVVFALAFGVGGLNLITSLFAFAFALVLMFGFENWFSGNAARFYPAAVSRIVRAPAPFPVAVMERLLAAVRETRSPKLKRDLQMLFRLSAGLSRRLGEEGAAAGAVGLEDPQVVEKLFGRTLELIEEIERIDEGLDTDTEEAVSARIMELERRTIDADFNTRPLLASALADQRSLFASLLDREKRRELLYSRLLQIASRLEALLRTLAAARSQSTAENQRQLSLIVKRLSVEVEAMAATNKEMAINATP